MQYIEQRGAGGVGDFGRKLAGQLEADVIFRQKQLADALEILRLVIAYP